MKWDFAIGNPPYQESGTTNNKAEAIYNTVYGKVVPEVPASILQFHSDIVLILDKEAAKLLKEEDYKIA